MNNDNEVLKVTGRVMSLAFMLDQGDSKWTDAMACGILRLSTGEMQVLKHYVATGSFIGATTKGD